MDVGRFLCKHDVAATRRKHPVMTVEESERLLSEPPVAVCLIDLVNDTTGTVAFVIDRLAAGSPRGTPRLSVGRHPLTDKRLFDSGSSWPALARGAAINELVCHPDDGHGTGVDRRRQRSEVMTIVGRVTAAEGRTDLLVPIYSYVLLWFFIYCYPIALWTKRLELRYAER